MITNDFVRGTIFRSWHAIAPMSHQFDKWNATQDFLAVLMVG